MTSLPLPTPYRADGLMPSWPGAGPMVSPTLARTLLLAMLLHVWLVLLLGNAPGGTAQRGQGVWGAINVTLRGPETRGVADPAPPPLPSGPAGAAEQPRWGGAVREAAPAPSQAPGAARLGEWAAETATGAVPAPAAAEPVPPAELLAQPDRIQRVEPVAPIERTAPALMSPQASPLPALPALPQPEPLPLPAPPSAAPPALATVPPPAAPPALAEMPAAERQMALPLPAPSGAVPALAAPAPAAALPALATAPALAPLPEPLSRLSPALSAPPAAVAPLQPPGAMPLAEAVALPAAAVPAWATAPPLPGGGAGSAGAADAGSQVGRDVATPPSAAASVPPRLNLQLARPRGGELSRFSTPGVLQLLPRPPELPDQLAKDIAKSAKEDCRKAHQGLGLLAVVPLAVEALKKDGGCKW